MPKSAHTDQMFSHFQTLAYLTGAGKLPLMMPAMIARMIPTDRLDMNLPPAVAVVFLEAAPASPNRVRPLTLPKEC
jgi:hypothetical protein